jgi:glycosyltransferase involved in cell wall biosynthesis
MAEPARGGLDFGALLPGVGVFGGVRRFLEIGNALRRRGHSFTLYTPAGTAPEWLPFSGRTRPLAELGGTHHDVLLCGEPSLLGDFERAGARLKLFYCVLEKLPDERRIVRHPGWVVLANSGGIRDRLRRRHGVRAEDAIGGVDCELFRPMAPPRPLRPEPLRILAYGRLSRARKGTRIVARACESLAGRLTRRFPAWGGALAHPVQLVLFDHLGPWNRTDPRPQLRTSIPVEFHLNRSQEDLARLYTSCDIFVSAERRAGWSNTVAEAMACGVPVVCTRSGTADLALHRETAWVVRWRFAPSFALALRALAARPELRESLRAAALERVRGYSWERVADRIEAVTRSRLG